MYSQLLSYRNDSARRSCSCREVPCEEIKNIHTNEAGVGGTWLVSCALLFKFVSVCVCVCVCIHFVDGN